MEKGNNFLAIAIIVASVIVGGSFIYGNSIGGNSDGTAQLAVNVEDDVTDEIIVERDISDDDVVLGDPSAPVVFVEFGDYQCPFCKQLSITEKRIREEYVATGKLKMVFRDFPLDAIHPNARPASEAAECARDHGKYWQYHDVLFERQDELPTMDYVSVARGLGIDEAEFKACFEGGKYKDEVERDYQDGIKLGVSGTPTSFINGKRIPGALPYEAFRDAIEDALRTASN